VAALKAQGSYESLQAAIAAAQHRIERISSGEDGEEGAYEAANPAQKIRVRFNKGGRTSVAPARSASKGLNLKLSGYGYGEALQKLGEPQLVVEGSRSEYRWDSMTEWYVNRPEGIEHGFTVAAPPAAGAASSEGEKNVQTKGKLIFVMQAEGEFVPRMSEDGESILFRSSATEGEEGTEIRYSKLHVVDAKDQKLPSRMLVLNEKQIAIEVEDAGAVYPIIVDPLFTTETSLPLPDWPWLRIGLLSLSGNTAVVAGQQSDGAFAALVYVREGNSWRQQAKLTSPDPSGELQLGSEVAISGYTIVVGAWRPGDEFPPQEPVPVACVYVRNGTAWTHEATLTPSEPEWFAGAVAINGNGDSIAVLSANSEWQAGVCIFAKEGGAWTQQAKLTSDVDSFGTVGYWGTSLAIDGNTVIAGAPYSSYPGYTGNYSGAAVAFVRTGANWAEHQTQILRPSDPYGQPDTSRFNGHYFGQGIAVRGKTAVIGGSWAYVFSQGDDGIWREQQKLERHHSDWSFQTSINETESIIATGNPTEGVSVYLRQGTSWVRQYVYEPNAPGWIVSVALSGDTMIAGIESSTSPTPIPQFQALVFRLGGEERSPAPVLVSTGQPVWYADGSPVGGTLKVSGDTAVIGTGLGESGATVFVRSGGEWVEQQKLVSPEGTSVNIGSGAAIAGDTIVIWDRWDLSLWGLGSGEVLDFADVRAVYEEALSFYGPGASFVGSVNVFRRVGGEWIFEQNLRPTDIVAFQGGSFGLFGGNVVIDGKGGRIIVECQMQQGVSSNRHTNPMYVFARGENGWTQEAKLPIALGWSVAVYGNTIAFISLDEWGLAPRISVFDLSGGTWVQKMIPEEYSAVDWSRMPVALADETMAIGRQFFTDIFLKKDGEWVHQQRLPVGPLTLALNDAGNMLATGVGEIFVRVGEKWWQEQSAPYELSYDIVLNTEGLFVSSPEDGSWSFYEGIPGILALTPQSRSSGTGPFSLSLEGYFFREGSVVQWNGVELQTTFVSSSQLEAAVLATPTTLDLYTALITVKAENDRVSSPQVFIVTAENIAVVESTVADIGQTVSVSTAPTSPTPNDPEQIGNTVGITASLINDGDAAPVTVSAAIYNSNPAPESTFFAAESGVGITGEFMDLQVKGADPEDSMTAYFYYPVDALESAASPVLKYYNGSEWANVLSSNGGAGVAPEKNTSDNLDGTISGGRFTVIFDQYSTPKITELGGTFFALAVPRTPLAFNGFLAPIGGADATGGSFATPLRTFKGGSTIPVKFTASRDGTAIVTGTHTLRASKYSSETTAGNPIDATPQGQATTGNKFVLKDGEWHFNLDTKATALTTGIWQLVATLSDGSQHHVWIQIK
jgi:hypothetical protein